MQIIDENNAETIKIGTGIVTNIYQLDDDRIAFETGGIMYNDGTEESDNFSVNIFSYDYNEFEQNEVVQIENHITVAPYEKLFELYNNCTKEEIESLITKEEYYQDPNYVSKIFVKKLPQKTNKIMIKL